MATTRKKNSTEKTAGTKETSKKTVESAAKTTSASKSAVKKSVSKPAAKAVAKTSAAKIADKTEMAAKAEKPAAKRTAVKSPKPAAKTSKTAAGESAVKTTAKTSRASSAKNSAKIAEVYSEKTRRNVLPPKNKDTDVFFHKVEYMNQTSDDLTVSDTEKNFAPENNSGDKKKKIVLIVIAVLLILALISFLGIRVLGGGRGEGAVDARANTLTLAQKYIDKGQYDKAMDLLNGLLISNPGDEEADRLLDQAIQLKKENSGTSSTNVIVQAPDSPYNINIDTDEITNAFKEQNEKQQQMINELLEQQRASQSAQNEEKAAELKAAAEQKKKEESERKAKEELLAQKNRAIKDKIAGINEKILAGKADLNTGNIDSALNNFSLAVNQLPLEEGEPEFSASKYSEVASAIYDAAQNEKDLARREKLKAAAITYVNKSLSVNPNDPVSHYILGMNYMESGDLSKAAKELSDAVKNDPNNYLYYYNLGRAQYRQKNYTEARNSFASSVKYNDRFDLGYYNLGLTCRRLKLNKDALSAFRSAHTVNPQNSKAYLEEARILNTVYKDSDGAVAAYNNVISIDPVNVNALNECGAVYSKLGQYAKAETYHRKAIALLKPGEQDPVTYYNLALALYNQNKLADAEKYAKISYDQKDSLSSSKDKAMIVYNYALIEDTLGNKDSAITLYKEVLLLDPDNSKTKNNLGKMFMEMTPPDPDTALTFFTDAYKIDKTFELENNLGSAYLAKEDYANAITHFQNALKQSPKDNTVRFNLAQAYSGAGQFDNAKTTYLDLLNADSKNWDSYIEVAKVFIAQKDTANAEAYLKILQQKNPTYRKSEVDKLLALAAVSPAAASSNER